MSSRAAVRRLPALIPLALALLAAPVLASPVEGRTLGGVPCRLIDIPVASPVGLTACKGVRPGGPVLTDRGLCSLNFMFMGSDGNRYMGTAGHCVLLDAADGSLKTAGVSIEKVYTPGSAPVARGGDGQRIGEFAYAILTDAMDFSLIRLHASVEASPQMCHFGGPTGINTDLPPLTEPVTLNQYGQGIGLGSLLPARSMLALGMPSPEHVFAQGLVVPGDSGSAVTSSDGRAVGVVVSTGAHASSLGTTGLDAGLAGITRITPQLERAARMLGIDLEMVTAPQL